MNQITRNSCKTSAHCSVLIGRPQSETLDGWKFPALFPHMDTDLDIDEIFDSIRFNYENLTNANQTNFNKTLFKHDEYYDEIDNSYEIDITEDNYILLICKCIQRSYECTLFSTIFEKNLVYDPILKLTYLSLYITIIIAAIIVNLILLGLIINKSSCLNFFYNLLRKFSSKTFSCLKRSTSLNANNSPLLVSLLVSYTLTIVYVLPRQLYLFYTGFITSGADCKFTEFTKAFAVSLSIYSLAAISLQQLLTLKLSTVSNSNRFRATNKTISSDNLIISKCFKVTYFDSFKKL